MYVDKTYYDNDYSGTPVDEIAEFTRLEKRASEVVDSMTNYKIPLGQSLQEYPPFIVDQFKKAVCAQIEYMAEAESNVNHGQSQVTSMNIGNFSYNQANGGESLSREQTRTSPAVISYLIPTGFLHSGVRTC